MNNASYAIGADIGGTHITAALIGLHDNAIVASSVKRTSVNAAGSADEIIAAWANCIRDAKQAQDVKSVCLAMPGPFDYEAGISRMRGQAKYEDLYGINVKERLAAALGFPVQHVFMDNDAACFLQGEVFSGAARAYADTTVIGVTLGTGLGSAVYKAGRSHNADMWQWPFKGSIAEEFLSTRWFVRRWQQMTGEMIKGVKEIKQLPVTSEKAKEVFHEFGKHLAAFLLEFVARESPAAIVIGGNIAKAYDWFGHTLASIIHTTYPAINIAQATLGEEAPLAGAVSSWLQKEQPLLSLA